MATTKLTAKRETTKVRRCIFRSAVPYCQIRVKIIVEETAGLKKLDSRETRVRVLAFILILVEDQHQCRNQQVIRGPPETRRRDQVVLELAFKNSDKINQP
jgi:hypothetical protein